MEIFYKYFLNIDIDLQKEIANCGLNIELGLKSLIISHNDERFQRIYNLMSDMGEVEQISTEFTKSEIGNAEYLQLNPSWHCGYPMPDNDNGYYEMTFDLSVYCPKCGVGLKQKAPFRMKKEPNWGKKHITQLYWVYDEYFVKPEIWENIFKPLGIGKIPVLHYKTEKELETVVQLKVDKIASSELLINSDQKRNTCESCGRLKYYPYVRGFYPKFGEDVDPSIHMIKTKEYWGSGASADRSIIVSHELYHLINENKIKGVSFTPMEN